MAGFCLLIPAGSFEGRFWTDLLGLGIAGTLLGSEYAATRPATGTRAG